MLFIIKQYINSLSKEDINIFLGKENINLDNEELNIIYNYIKKDWYNIIYNEKPIFSELKNKISTVNYNLLYSLYIKYKTMYKNYI